MKNIEKKLFTAWMGPENMTHNRILALNSIVYNCSVPVHFISKDNLNSWIHPDFPLHSSFPYLSAVHQCDYLRCYVLHVYGGGYTDLKPSFHNWNLFFDRLQNSDNMYGAGYTEIGEHGVACVGGELEFEMKKNYLKLIGMCSLIFYPLSNFTFKWFDNMHNILDYKLSLLISNPAKHPLDHLGALFEGGHISTYPVQWTELGGNILHPLIYDNYNKFLHLDMAPVFYNYR